MEPASSPYGTEMKTTSIRGVNIESGGLAVEYGNLVTIEQHWSIT